MTRILCALVAAFFVATAALASPATHSYSVDLEFPDQVPRPHVPFMEFVRTDGRVVSYYATGDRYLESAFALLDGYWGLPSGASPSAVRPHLKTFLPLELQKLRHEPAELLMRHFADSFYRARDPRTGLIPYSTTSWSAFSPGDELRAYLVYQTTEYFQRWFPNDRDLLQKNVELAEAILRLGDPCGGASDCGMHGVLNVRTGASGQPTARVQDYGLVGIMMTDVSARSGDKRFAAWAARKQDFIWETRPFAPLPLLADAYTPEGAVISAREPLTSDTDTLYNVRRLFEMYALARHPTFLQRAMALTDFWYERAWDADWGHFVRKLNPDGSPATDSLYGDGMYNTLFVLIHAFKNTGDVRYLDRVREAYGNLKTMGRDGLLPRHVRRGEMIAERGFSNQAMFIHILLDAYDASGDSRFLCDAERLADNILLNENQAFVDSAARGFAGAALLRLALARGPIGRLDVDLPAPGENLTIKSAAGAILLEKAPSADIATVYAPQGTYIVETGRGAHKRVRTRYAAAATSSREGLESE